VGTTRTRPAARPRRPEPARPTAAAPPGALPSLVTGLVTLGLYLALAPSVAGDKDSSEFTLVLARLGSAHPTGYPLYTLLGHAFVTLLHAAGVGWDRAANAWSAVGGAVAMGLLHALAARLLAREGVPARPAAVIALLPVAAFVLNPLVTIETTLAEVNAFHLAWVAGAMLALLAHIDSLRGAGATGDSRRVAAAGDPRRFAVTGLIAGLGLAHHATSVFVIGPAGIALLVQAARARRLDGRVLAAAALGVAVPLTAYAWIAWRAFHPGMPQWSALDPTWLGVWRHITGFEYRVYLGHWAPSTVQRAAMTKYLWPWFAAFAAAALVWAWRGRGTPGPVRAAWVAIIAIATIYGFRYGVPDPSSYFLPPFMLACAAAPAAFARWAARPALRPAAALLALGLLVQDAWWFHIGRERGGAYLTFERRIHAMWVAVPFDSGFVLWSSDMVHRLHKYQWLDGEKPHLEAINPLTLTFDAPRAEFVRRHGFDPADRGRIDARLSAAQPGDMDAFSRVVADEVVAEVNAGTPLPVVRFMPEVPQMTLLDKPGADSTRAGHVRPDTSRVRPTGAAPSH
jgi:hypothetical protein